MDFWNDDGLIAGGILDSFDVTAISAFTVEDMEAETINTVITINAVHDWIRDEE